MKIKILFIFFIALVSGCSSTSSIDPSMIMKLSGTWDEATEGRCSTNYHTITINGSVLKLSYVEKGYISETDGRQTLTYSILSAEDNFLRVQLENETRLDSKGKPVIWHLKPLTVDQYCWGRDDWGQSQCTVPRVKCKLDK